MPRQSYFCHECSHEGNDFLETPSPQCPSCQGSFVEEIPPQENPQADDPRDFDPDDAGLPPFGQLFGRVGANMFNPTTAAGGGGQPAFLRVNVGPDGSFVQMGGGMTGERQQGGGGDGNANQGQQQQAPVALSTALMRAFGLAQPQQRWREAEDVEDPREEDLAGLARDRRTESEGGGRDQVPIQNLAAFLGEAFGDPHPADHPSNNPFAEGGTDSPPPERIDERETDGEGAARAAGGGAGGGNPLNYLLSLMNSFGINGQMVGPGIGMAGNAGDYVWGGEANFQALLNDLMEQAAGRSKPVPAPKEMIDELPRVEVTSELLGHDTIKDCTICQDDFTLSETLISLPCRHLFHPDCIVPWLEQSGTCPVCRHALVPQPGSETREGGEDQSSTTRTASSTQNQGFTEASTSSPSSSSSRPRPPLPRNSSVPSTARIPEVAAGATLPGSWTFGGSNTLGGGGGGGDVMMDIDQDQEGEEGFWTDAENEQEEDNHKSPERRAAEAAERRIAREREERLNGEGGTRSDLPIIEDVD